MKEHPSEMQRVTVESVRATLDGAGVRFVGVWQWRVGVVCVDVTGWTQKARRRAQQAVCAALEPKGFSEFWHVPPAGQGYRWRPWETWVAVYDAGLEWFDGQGRDYLEAAEIDAQRRNG